MCFSIVAAIAVLSAAADRPTLRGVVQGSDGSPLAGVTVMIYTARPRVGTSTFCPSCHLDCGRRATTGADGRFEIPRLDPKLVFQVVAIAEKHEVAFQRDVDPTTEEVKFTLLPGLSLPSDPRRVVRGKMLGPTGPVAEAVVEVEGVTRGRVGDLAGWSTTFGESASPTVTNASGEFEIVLREGGDSVVLLVSPRGLTRRTFDVSTGMAPTKVQVTYGAAVRGRIVRAGQPMAGIAVNLQQQDRNAEHWVGPYSATTDSSGSFMIVNVLPSEEVVVVGASQDLAPLGYVAPRMLKTEADGTVVDVGELEVRPGHRVSGKVVLSDGKGIPQHTQLMIDREEAGDFQNVELSSDGSFEVAAVPDDVVSLSARVPGYGLSRKNASLAPGGTDLLGRVGKDLTLTVLLEPEQHRAGPIVIDQHTAAAFSRAKAALREKPLAGVEVEIR